MEMCVSVKLNASSGARRASQARRAVRCSSIVVSGIAFQPSIRPFASRSTRVAADVRRGSWLTASTAPSRSQQPRNNCDDRRRRLVVETPRRFVGEQQLRGVRERTGDCDALPLTTRELGRAHVFPTVEVHRGQECLGPFASLTAVELAAEHDDLDVLLRIEMRQQVVELEDHPDLLPAEPIEPMPVRHVTSIDANVSRVRPVERRDEVDRGRLAAARRPDEHDELAGFDAQREVIEHASAVAAKRLDDIVDLERATHAATPKAVSGWPPGPRDTGHRATPCRTRSRARGRRSSPRTQDGTRRATARRA